MRRLSKYILVLTVMLFVFVFSPIESHAASLNKTFLNTIKGKTYQLQLKDYSGKCTWKTTNKKVVTVNSKGKVACKSAGTCTIYVVNAGKKYKCSVTAFNSFKDYKVAALEKKYKVSKNRTKILLAGSSTIEYWDTAESDLAPYDVVNMGIRGSKVNDWMQLYKRLIIKYEPHTLVLFIGGNDISLKATDGIAEVTATKIQKLIKKIRTALPGTTIYYVSIQPSVYRWKVWNYTKKCNSLMKKFCASQDDVYFIDITKYCLLNGVPDDNLYRSDQLHFNDYGYRKIWRNVVAKRIKNDLEKYSCFCD